MYVRARLCVRSLYLSLFLPLARLLVRSPCVSVCARALLLLLLVFSQCQGRNSSLYTFTIETKIKLANLSNVWNFKWGFKRFALNLSDRQWNATHNTSTIDNNNNNLERRTSIILEIFFHFRSTDKSMIKRTNLITCCFRLSVKHDANLHLIHELSEFRIDFHSFRLFFFWFSVNSFCCATHKKKSFFLSLKRFCSLSKAFFFYLKRFKIF